MTARQFFFVKNQKIHVMKKFSKAVSLRELFQSEIEKEQERKLSDIPSGNEEINRVIGGFRFGEIVLMAGRPAMGVSMLLLRSILRISKSVSVLYCSLDINNRGTINKVTSLHKDGGRSFFENHFEQSELKEEFCDENIYVASTIFTSIEEYILLIAHHVQKDNINVVVFDNFESLPETNSTYGIVAVLKEIAEVFNITIILGGTLDQSCEKRGGDKKPRLRDIGIGTHLFPMLDIVLLLYRPEYYGFLQDEYGNSTAGRMEIIIAKDRNNEPFDLKVDCLFYDKTITS